MDGGATRRRWLSVAIWLTIGLTLVVGIAVLTLGGFPAAVIYGLLGPLVAAVIASLLLHRGHELAAARLFVWSIWGIVTCFCYLSGGAGSPIALSFVSTTVMAGALAAPSAGLWVGAASAAALAVMALLERAGYPAAHVLRLNRELYWAIQAASLMFAGYLAFEVLRGLQAGLARAHEGEQALRELVQSAPEGIVAVDERGVVHSINPAANQALGAPSTDTSIFDLAWTEPASVRRLFDASTSEQSGGIVAELRHPSGDVRELELIVHGLPHLRAGGATHRLSIRDVTERRRAERARDQLDARVRKAERLEALGLVAGGVAHDFNNLNTVILINAQLLMDRATNDRTRQMSEEIVLAAKRSAELAHQLLAFGRKQVRQPEVLQLSAQVRQATPILRHMLREDVELSVELDDAVWANVDGSSLVQVLINLVSNARDAMPRGGRVVIRVFRTTRTAAEADPEVPAGDYAAIQVEDTGAGLAPEIRAQMFEPFFTTKAPGQGTGLGLAVVQSIVAQNDGHVEVTSENDRGTTFTLLFPACAPAATTAASTAVNPARPRQLTILLVEDDATVRQVASRILREGGHAVQEAADGEEGLRIATDARATFDVLLTDIVMPKLSGVELARALIPTHPGLAVVLMSGYVADAFGADGRLIEGCTFLAKPFTEAQLLAAVDGAVAAISPFVATRVASTR